MSQVTEDDKDLMQVYRDLLHPAVAVFNDIKAKGVWVDQESLHELDLKMQQILVEQQEKLTEITEDETFNPNSPKQIQHILWDKLKLNQPKIYNRKDRSADKETLEKLFEAYPDILFIKELMLYRKTFTLYSRYVRDLPNYIETDGRVRVNYHFDRTETGRLSTTDPALHQIPRDSNIRSIYSAPDKHVLIQADYEQIEIRMAAHVAQDEKLIALLKSGTDFHTLMASQAFNVDIDKVKKEQRQAAKNISFGLLYLMSDKGLINLTGLPPAEAVTFINNYKALMPDVQRWITAIKETIRSKRFVVSPFGRRRRFPEITWENINGFYREGVNFPIQSGASDITLSSVIRLHMALKHLYPEAQIVIMVHDSIIVECPEVIAQEVADLMKQIMEDIPSIVPFPVEIKIGKRWGESN